VHGHSEGGFVAQALEEKVDGIIATGAACGFGDARVYRAGKGVPLLLILGTRDQYVTEGASAKMLARTCSRVRGTGPMTFVSVPGMDHFAAIWWPQVHDAVAKFLKIPPFKIAQAPSQGIAYPKISDTYMQTYQAGAANKALAVGKDGSWGWSFAASSKFDAEEEALFGCDDAARADVFLDTQHAHYCVLVDVNGKKLVK
jgi:hypothetical protein